MARDMPVIEDTEFVVLQLRDPGPNGARRVPPTCAICLCPYGVDDLVTHSPREECQHAFHYECITTWLAKKPQPLCPCCRQIFCEIPRTIITKQTATTITTTTTTIAGSRITMTTIIPTATERFMEPRPRGAFDHLHNSSPSPESSVTDASSMGS
mmetsp:Transcript_32437/g.74529  ORF Transcript_32437/g.74529 Transcript_32437/m.74529 type:complete len:155 (+) Transcript_32437:751-1215(+)